MLKLVLYLAVGASTVLAKTEVYLYSKPYCEPYNTDGAGENQNNGNWSIPYDISDDQCRENEMVGFDQGYPRQSLLVNAQPGELVEGCLSLWTGARCDGAGSKFKFALNDTFARCYTYDRQDDFAPIRGWASYRFAPASVCKGAQFVEINGKLPPWP